MYSHLSIVIKVLASSIFISPFDPFSKLVELLTFNKRVFLCQFFLVLCPIVKVTLVLLCVSMLSAKDIFAFAYESQ